VLCSGRRCILNCSCCCLSPHSVDLQATTTPSNGCTAEVGRQTTGNQCRSWTDLRFHDGFAKHLHRRTVSAYYFDHGQRAPLSATAFAELAAACFWSQNQEVAYRDNWLGAFCRASGLAGDFVYRHGSDYRRGRARSEQLQGFRSRRRTTNSLAVCRTRSQPQTGGCHASYERLQWFKAEQAFFCGFRVSEDSLRTGMWSERDALASQQV